MISSAVCNVDSNLTNLFNFYMSSEIVKKKFHACEVKKNIKIWTIFLHLNNLSPQFVHKQKQYK